MFAFYSKKLAAVALVLSILALRKRA